MGKRAAGEGSVYQLKDGRWRGKLFVGYEGDKRKHVYVYAKTQEKALDKLTLARADYLKGQPG